MLLSETVTARSVVESQRIDNPTISSDVVLTAGALAMNITPRLKVKVYDDENCFSQTPVSNLYPDMVDSRQYHIIRILLPGNHTWTDLMPRTLCLLDQWIARMLSEVVLITHGGCEITNCKPEFRMFSPRKKGPGVSLIKGEI